MSWREEFLNFGCQPMEMDLDDAPNDLVRYRGIAMDELAGTVDLISKRKTRASRCFIESLPRALDGAPEVGIHDRLTLQEIDSLPEKIAEAFEKTEKTVRMLGRSHRRKFHQKIEVAGRRIEIVLQRGTKEVEPRDAVPEAEIFKSSEVLLNQGMHSRLPLQGGPSP